MNLQELEQELNSMELPESIQIAPAEFVFDVDLFIDGHVKTLKANSGNKNFMPYYNRLLKLYNLCR